MISFQQNSLTIDKKEVLIAVYLDLAAHVRVKILNASLSEGQYGTEGESRSVF